MKEINKQVNKEIRKHAEKNTVLKRKGSYLLDINNHVD
jgi:hypothetical protein